MVRELLVSHTSALTVYAVGRIPHRANIGLWGSVLNAALEVFAGANWTTYVIPMNELGTTGFYEGDMPALFNGEHAVEIYFFEQVGGAPAMTDTKVSGTLFANTDVWVAESTLRV